MKKAITVTDVEAELGVSLYAVFLLLRHKKLNGFKHGDTWHIQRRDLNDYRKRNPVTPEGPEDWRGIPAWLEGIK